MTFRRMNAYRKRVRKRRRKLAKRLRRSRYLLVKGLRRSRYLLVKSLRRGCGQLRKRRELAWREAYAIYNRRHRRTYAKRLDRIPARDELPALLNRRGLTGTGVEVGVKLGKFSDQLLREWGGTLISIDPWLSDDPGAYVDRANVAQEEHDRFYAETQERLRPYGERSEIWRMTSVEGAVEVADASLDFAYIDARHDYESVLEDLEAWFPKVRPGGIFAGHDYASGVFEQGDFGVKRAVDEFFGARGIPVNSTNGRQPAELFPTWIVEIPAP